VSLHGIVRSRLQRFLGVPGGLGDQLVEDFLQERPGLPSIVSFYRLSHSFEISLLAGDLDNRVNIDIIMAEN
jgi:hypothetical protein